MYIYRYTFVTVLNFCNHNFTYFKNNKLFNNQTEVIDEELYFFYDFIQKKKNHWYNNLKYIL